MMLTRDALEKVRDIQILRLKEELANARKLISDMAVHPSCPKCGTQRLKCEHGHAWEIA